MKYLLKQMPMKELNWDKKRYVSEVKMEGFFTIYIPNIIRKQSDYSEMVAETNLISKMIETLLIPSSTFSNKTT